MILPDPIEMMEDAEERAFYRIRDDGWAAADRGARREPPASIDADDFLREAWLEGWDNRDRSGGTP